MYLGLEQLISLTFQPGKYFLCHALMKQAGFPPALVIRCSKADEATGSTLERDRRMKTRLALTAEARIARSHESEQDGVLLARLESDSRSVRGLGRSHVQTINHWLPVLGVLIVMIVGEWFTVFAITLGNDAGEIQQRAAKVRAAYVFQITNYVDWPNETFPDANVPFVIGVVGETATGHYLETIAKSKPIKGHPIKYVVLKDATTVKDCHLIFIAEATPMETIKSILAACADRPIMVIGENINSFALGAVVNLPIEADQVRLYLSMNAAKSRQLRISSKLASIAKMVE